MEEEKLQEENPNALLAETQEEALTEEESSESETGSEQEQDNSIESTETTMEELPDTTIMNPTEETIVVTETEAVSDSGMQEGTPPYFILGGVVLIVILFVSALAVIIRGKRKKMKYVSINETTISPGAGNQKAVKLMETPKNCPVQIASIHDVGRRSAQQDSFGISDVKENTDYKQKGVLAIVADGMGGLSDGDRISQLVVVTMLKGFDEDDGTMPPASLLLKLVHDANMEVSRDLGEEKLGTCGSTLTAVIVKEQKLSWISVGDSHIYVYRKGRLVKMNQDHNYAAELDAMVNSGELTREEAMNDPQRGALTSFIGMGELELVDQNENPIVLEKEDRILLMSDGVFGTIPETRIVEIMNMPLLQACEQMELEIRETNKHNQDNYTCVILEVR